MPTVICRRQEFKWGMQNRAMSQKTCLQDVQCFDHRTAHNMYVTFSAKGLIMLSTADFIMPVTEERMNMEHYWNNANRAKHKDSEQNQPQRRIVSQFPYWLVWEWTWTLTVSGHWLTKHMSQKTAASATNIGTQTSKICFDFPKSLQANAGTGP